MLTHLGYQWLKSRIVKCSHTEVIRLMLSQYTSETWGLEAQAIHTLEVHRTKTIDFIALMRDVFVLVFPISFFEYFDTMCTFYFHINITMTNSGIYVEAGKLY